MGRATMLGPEGADLAGPEAQESLTALLGEDGRRRSSFGLMIVEVYLIGDGYME